MILALLACAGASLTDTGKPGDSVAPAETTWYADADGDGYGDASVSTTAAESGSGWVADSTDCDDADAAVHPGADETCDGVDQDCDGNVDEDAVDPATWYADADGDGFGGAGSTTRACSMPVGYADTASDCDDADGAVFPGADEVCGNGLDDDCAGDGDLGCRPEGEHSLGEVDTRIDGSEEGAGYGGVFGFTGDVLGTGRPVAYLTNGASPSEVRFFSVDQGEALTSPDANAELSIYGSGSNQWSIAEPAYPVGDLTGDGFDDVLVTPYQSIDGFEFGIFTGPLGPASELGDATYVADDTLPADLVRVLRNDDDSEPQLAVGKSGWSFGGGYAVGQVYVLSGPFTGMGTDASIVATLRPSPELHDGLGFGYGLCTADLDGDGVDDIAAAGLGSVYEEEDHWLWNGVVYVALGPFDADRQLDDRDGKLDEGDGIWTDAPGGGYTQAGKTLRCGDATGDGLPDVLVGDDDTHEYGHAWLFAGPATGQHVFDDAAWTLTGDADNAVTGFAATLDSDVDGDGRRDVAVSSLGTDNAGRVGLFYAASGLTGSATMAEADATWTGEAPDDYAVTISGGADLDGDGFDELFIGAYGHTGVADQSGAAYIVYGGAIP